jgi:predicted RNase H-like nuclease (RuvC/YqgF family)
VEKHFFSALGGGIIDSPVHYGVHFSGGIFMTEPTPGEGLTFEKVWIMFQEAAKRSQETERQMKENDRLMKERMEESDRRLKETMAETERQMKESDRRLKESQAETDRQMKETDRQMKETDRQMKETDRKLQEASRMVGDLGNKFGKLAEHLVVPNLMEKFNALGYEFTRTCRNIKILGPDKKRLTEIDILLENGDSVIVVEVKSEFTDAYVSQHVERMEKLRRYWDAHNDKRKLIGAVAGAIMEDSVKVPALAAGFYVIVQSGDTLKIEVPEGFTPKVW